MVNWFGRCNKLTMTGWHQYHSLSIVWSPPVHHKIENGGCICPSCIPSRRLDVWWYQSKLKVILDGNYTFPSDWSLDPLEKCVYKPISGSYLRLFQNTSQISSWCHLDGCVVNTTLFAAVLLHSMNWIALKLATDLYKDPAQSLRWIMRGRGQYQGIIEASGVDIKICVTRTHCRIMSHKKGRLTLKYCDAEWKVTAGSFVLEWMTKVCSSIKY